MAAGWKRRCQSSLCLASSTSLASRRLPVVKAFSRLEGYYYSQPSFTMALATFSAYSLAKLDAASVRIPLPSKLARRMGAWPQVTLVPSANLAPWDWPRPFSARGCMFSAPC